MNLLHNRNEHSALMVAVENAHIETSRLLLKSGADVNHSCSGPIYSCTELVVKIQGATADKSLTIMKMLLFYGADLWALNLRDEDIATPLNIAMEEIESTDDNEIFGNYVFLLYTAGASHVIRQLNNKPSSHESCGYSTVSSKSIIRKVIKYIINPINADKSLTNLCRRTIRAHLLKSKGNNFKNLIHAVSELPLPDMLKKFLLFDLDIPWMNESV